jgi:hypothetical protein
MSMHSSSNPSNFLPSNSNFFNNSSLWVLAVSS